MLVGPRSRDAFARACTRMPGGVNSPVRAWGRLGGEPAVIARGEGCRMIDVDGRSCIDYVLSWGPLLHGHAHPEVVAAVQEAAARGTSFGAPTEGETDLADLLCEALPSLERVRMVNSGTEATMSALRVARAFTGREVIVKCEGCYHGHADHLLVAAGSGAATFGNPDSAGVPASFASCTAVVPYNDADAMADLFSQRGDEIAAVIIEPVAGNMGFIEPRPGYLQALRDLCDQHGALLIFDEVMTGFRVAWGGEQLRSGITPDLTCLGKVIGGGLPAAAYGGRADVMQVLAPEGPCYQAGTLSGNPLAVAAGLANLRLAGGQAFYDAQEARLQGLVNGMSESAERHGMPLQVGCRGTMWGFYLSGQPVHDFAGASASDLQMWERFVRALYEGGVYVAPSPFEAAFFSSAHDDEAIAETLEVVDRACAVAVQG